MNREVLLNHFDRISEAPDAVPKLRQFILDLAVRGKLVDQIPDDEPASFLLRNIRDEKARLKSTGAISPPTLAEMAADVFSPFTMRAGWQAVRLGEVLLELQTGPFGSSLHQSDYRSGGTPVINPASIQDGQIVPIASMAVGDDTLDRLANFKLRSRDIVMARRGEMGRCAVVTPKETGWLCGTGCLVLRLPSMVCPRFLAMLIGSPFARTYLGGVAVGATMQNLNQAILLNLVIGLPPEAEQPRIVAKVDELMSLCDLLEEAQKERELRRDRLTEASVHHLNKGMEWEEAVRHARFYINHLPRLTTRPEALKILRRTILELAVKGQLTRAEHSDGPVSRLLDEIGADIGTKIRVDASRSPAAPATDIPDHWHRLPLRSLITFGPQNGVSPRPTTDSSSPKCLTLTATTSGALDSSFYKHVELSHAACAPYWLRRGDVLFQRGNTRDYVGMAAVYEGDDEAFIFPDLMIRVRFTAVMNLRFLHYALLSPTLRTYFSTAASGGAATMPKINQGILLTAELPIPPRGEQDRIVSKLDELFATCVQLKVHLDHSRSVSAALLESVLHRALEDAEVTLPSTVASAYLPSVANAF